MKLNLQTKTKEQELIKKYLEENASEMLIEKINNPKTIVKDRKTLINKKYLDTFMKFACEKAKKLAEKSENSTCVQDNIVYGWAIHYFEEDTIIGNLYNENGTEFKPIVKSASMNLPTPTSYIPKINKEKKPQISLFDMITNNQNNYNDDTEEIDEEDIEDAFNVMEKDNNIDKETGEIIATDKNDILSKIIEIFENNIIVRN